MSNISHKLSELSSLIERSYSILEERKRMIQLDIKPSIGDDQELTSGLNKIVKKLTYFEDDLIDLITSNGKKSQYHNGSKKLDTYNNSNLMATVNQLTMDFNNRVSQYDKLLDNIEFSFEKEEINHGHNHGERIINIDDYRFIKKQLPEVAPVVKTVRFKDNLIEEEQPASSSDLHKQPYKDDDDDDDDDLNMLNSSIGSVHVSTATTVSDAQDLSAHQHDQMKASLFRPYSDNNNPSSISNDNNNNNDDDNASTPSNHQMLIQQQQSLLQQDDALDSLSQSIRRQREMGLSINGELDDQMVILDDLEAQMNTSERRLHDARKNLHKVNVKMKEHGHCFIITVLALILFVLVVIL
ncbi:hypothetical protein DASC09_032440 [Saccharomycopsis crataegensis]|uniref:t-SNARE coiled-coil homology domain-containing protein n=1 Tax=Saccharomycopsis crataegensis TaxID=43959 RepID=A0AAV5QMF4_9ASCO|nr:hypothetical protein DASC09_032440 [Saccharomycopsis crataegensis]